MSKTKHKVARYVVSVNEPQKKMLEEMMQEDAQTDASAFWTFVLVQEWKRRESEKAKRPVGRPHKATNDEENQNEEDLEENWDDDLPKTTMYYGQLIGPKQMKYYEEVQKMFRPK